MSLKSIKVNELKDKSEKINSKSKIFESFKKAKRFSVKWESYFNVYEKIFEKYREQNITFVEVGVSAGGSLQMWRDFLGTNARIIGIDLNPEAKTLEKDGFEIFIGNQSDPKFWKDFYSKIGNIDILLDDGGHKNIQQINTVHNSIENINDGGLIVVEDTHASYLKEFKNPSYFSFINFCNKIIENIHRRCAGINKKINLYSKKVHSVSFYESIVVFNIDSEKCFESSMLANKDEWDAKMEQRDSEYFGETKKFIQKKLSFVENFKFLRKILRVILYKNPFFSVYEKIKILKIFKELN